MKLLASVLRGRVWMAVLPMVATAAFLNATAVAELIGARIAADAAELASHAAVLNVAPRPATAPSTTHARSAAPILARNPFDHETGSLLPAAAQDAAAGASGIVDGAHPDSAPSCEGVDVDVIVASDDEDWSMAALTGSDKETHLRRRGGEIAGKVVQFIGRDRVWLSERGTLCQARLFDGTKAAAPPPPPPPSAAPPRVARGPRPLDPDLRRGIQAVSPTEFNIDRGVLDRIIEDQAGLMRQARVIPEQQNGRVIGMRLLGIRPDTLLGVLGMRHGDRLEAINGFEMTNPQTALEAYARLRTAEKISVRINRGGTNMDLQYNIR